LRSFTHRALADQHLASRADIDVPLVVIGEVLARERPIGSLGLVEHRHVGFDASGRSDRRRAGGRRRRCHGCNRCPLRARAGTSSISMSTTASGRSSENLSWGAPCSFGNWRWGAASRRARRIRSLRQARWQAGSSGPLSPEWPTTCEGGGCLISRPPEEGKPTHAIARQWASLSGGQWPIEETPDA
jgi:hypothetical protein